MQSSDSAAVQKDIVLSKSRDVLESYIFSTSNRDFSIYSERLLMEIVAVAQQQLAGANFRDGTDIGQVSIGPLGHAVVEIPLRNLMGSKSSTNYSQARKAIMELMRSPYFVERPKVERGVPVLDENGEQVFELIGRQILNSCDVNVRPGFAVIEVNATTWSAILDFSKGFRRYSLQVARSLKKSASVRLFRLICYQRTPITYTVQRLREMWSMKDKYKDTNDFIKRTVEAAKEELDAVSPWTFDYVCNYSSGAEENRGRRGRKSITSVTFFPKERLTKLSTSALLNEMGTDSVLPRETADYLRNTLMFTGQGIKNNILLFETARRVGMDLDGFLRRIAPKATRASSCQGYVIRAVERHLKEEYGVEKTTVGYSVPDLN